MISKTPAQTCPSCHSGALVRTEALPENVRAKYFSCGHRKYEVPLEGQMDMPASLTYKAKHRSRGKPYVKGKTGADFYRAMQKWVVDRENDRYKERVTDPESG